jgi:Ca2+-transporting ATPase
MMSYFNLSAAETAKNLSTTINGLDQEEVNRRQEVYGLNELQEKKKIPVWLQFLHQFRDFMIIILIAAAVLSGIMGDMTDTIIILVIVLLNAVVGFVQEYRAGKAIDALKKMSVTQAMVVRDGHALSVSSNQLVPGDVVLIESGNIVPADVRLMETHSLRIDESSLTGESVPVDKNQETLTDKNIPLGDQLNLAFKGTLVTNGRGKGLVIATGMSTELGKIANLLQGNESMTPLQIRMDHFGKRLSYIILFICVVLLITGLLRGEDPFRIILLSISLAVAAIPEALPALITIALSKGASRLAKENALVRKLPAVETLGSVTFICSDKTGTLTQNRMKVVDKHEVVHHAESMPGILTLCMALNHDVKFNDVHEPFGESTELALVQQVLEDISFNEYEGINVKHPRMAELPFDSDRKCMTTVHHFDGQFLIITKGATESIFTTITDNEEKQWLNHVSNDLASKGKRVLAYAFQLVPVLPSPFIYEEVEKNLKLAGLVALIDPPREEVKSAIAECKTAGIKPVMITGDHPATAKAIAREIGILEEHDLTLTGVELQHLEERTFSDQVENVAVYARVSPDQKLRIVQALQAKNHFVSMTGDGVNDAPSLKAANIGVAMGINGTDVSKEAAHLVLLDDNFATIVKAVKEGRRIFDNIRKFVKYIMTCNGAEIWTIFLAPLMGMPIPLLPIHLLWINLVTDGLPALALAGEKAERDIMKRPPRSASESLFSDGVGFHILWVGLLMAGVTLGTQAWALNNEMEHWQTMVFTVLSLSQLGHIFGIRSDRTFLFKQGLFSNLPLLGSVVFTFILQLCVIYLPFMNDIFKTAPLSLEELSICLILSLVVFHAVELEKWLKRIYRK